MVYDRPFIGQARQNYYIINRVNRKWHIPHPLVESDKSLATRVPREVELGQNPAPKLSFKIGF